MVIKQRHNNNSTTGTILILLLQAVSLGSSFHSTILCLPIVVVVGEKIQYQNTHHHTTGSAVADNKVVRIDANENNLKNGEDCDENEEQYDSNKEEEEVECTSEYSEDKEDYEKDEDDDCDYHMVNELWDKYDCGTIINSENHDLSIPDTSIWKILQDVYVSVVGKDQSSLFLDTPSFQVPYEVRHSQGKGRGLFMTESVRNGTMIWTNTHTAAFTKGSDYRKFIERVPDSVKCDCLMWHYVMPFDKKVEASGTQPEGEEVNAVISADLDESCFANNANEYSDCNVYCELDQRVKETGLSCYAARDIQADEEILVWYGDFANSDGWCWFDLYDDEEKMEGNNDDEDNNEDAHEL